MAPVKTVRMGDDHVCIYRSLMIKTVDGIIEVAVFANNHESQISIESAQ